MKVSLLQFDIAWECPEKNYARIELLMEQGGVSEGSLVLMPEMFSTGFSMTSGGGLGDEDFLSRLAKKYRCYLLAGSVKQVGNCRKNVLLVINPLGEKFCEYEKQQLFTFSGEHEHYQAGSRSKVFAMEAGLVAPFICYDLRFPELFRAGVAQGAEVLVVVASWPARRVSHWITLLQARAIENQAYVIGVNRTGKDPHATYPGRSMVIDPQGVIIADASDQTGLLHASLDLVSLREWRKVFPAVSDYLAWASDPTKSDDGR